MLRHEFNYLILLITCLTQLLADLKGGCTSIMYWNFFKCTIFNKNILHSSFEQK